MIISAFRNNPHIFSCSIPANATCLPTKRAFDPAVLRRQSELATVLGQYADVGMNFVSGAPLNERNRVEVLIDDQGLYRETQVR